MEDMEDQKDISNQISEALTRNTEDMFDDVSEAESRCITLHSWIRFFLDCSSLLFVFLIVDL